MMSIVSYQPFRFPYPMNDAEQTIYCLGIINKYRQELPYLRGRISILRKQKDNIEKDIEYWKDKYHYSQEKLKKTKKENERLKEEIERLTKTKIKYQVALFDHGNFKVKENKSNKIKGGQIGHLDTNREAKEDYSSFEKKRLFSKTCGNCHSFLPRVSATRKKVLLDIVVDPQVTKLILESERQWCPKCKKEVNAKHAQSLPFTEYGINTFMIVMILRFKSHASLLSCSTVISLGFGLTLSKSDIANLLTQAKQYLGRKYKELISAIRDGEVMYNDETGWLVRGKSAWMWIAANDKATVYFAAESRGKGIAKEIYGGSFAYSMHDDFASYKNALPKEKHLFCWAHFLRFVHEEILEEKETSEGSVLKDELVNIYHLKKKYFYFPKEDLKAILSKRINQIFRKNLKSSSAIKIQEKLRKNKGTLINALLLTPDGTNNLAERELRTMVINEKISYGSDTFSGMEKTAILGSIIQTLSRKKETDFFSELKGYLQKGIQEKYPQYLHMAYYDSS